MSFDLDFLNQIQADIRRKVCAGHGRPDYRKITNAADILTPGPICKALLQSAYDSRENRRSK